MCVLVFSRVQCTARERERVRERESERARERESEKEREGERDTETESLRGRTLWRVCAWTARVGMPKQRILL